MESASDFFGVSAILLMLTPVSFRIEGILIMYSLLIILMFWYLGTV
jgi:hypothetical protein